MEDWKVLLRRFWQQQAELFPSEIYFIEGETPKLEGSQNLKEIEQVVLQCQKCSLAQTRTNVVFGMGDPHAEIMFIGEAPGENEDLQGLPFVGRAGELLDRILAAIALKRSQVYIANIIKCRPPNNRTPNSEEVESCFPYLFAQIEAIQPKLIVCLGLVAARNLLHIEYKLGDFRGKIFQFNGIDVVVTYHPAAILRNPNLKPDTWEDFKMIRKLYLEKRGS